MSAPPSKSAISGTPTNAEAKTAFAALWDYVVGRLGGDAAAPAPTAPEKAAARTALGASTIGDSLFTAADAAAARTAIGVSTGLTRATAVAATSGAAIDFTGLPSWAKRITVMFSNVSTSGANNIQVQLGSGSFTTTGYTSSAAHLWATPTVANSISGLLVTGSLGAAAVHFGSMVITNVTGNTWVAQSGVGRSDAFFESGGGGVALSGVLDRVRITTVGGTDTFDAGTINIMYEG
jgi:hypothetical protein